MVFAVHVFFALVASPHPVRPDKSGSQDPFHKLTDLSVRGGIRYGGHSSIVVEKRIWLII